MWPQKGRKNKAKNATAVFFNHCQSRNSLNVVKRGVTVYDFKPGTGKNNLYSFVWIKNLNITIRRKLGGNSEAVGGRVREAGIASILNKRYLKY